jgi:broad specificity phosphatase PhoE
MSVILLVRHGQASFDAADYDLLSSLGEEQSRLLGVSLASRGVRPDVIVSGSMKRHRQTASAVVDAAGWGTSVVEDADWDEYDQLSTVDGGLVLDQVEGGSRAERMRVVEQTIDRWSSGEHDDEYRESFPAFRERVSAAMTGLVEGLGAKQTAVVFTSGGPVSWVSASLSDGGLDAWQRLSKVVVNSGVTKVLTGGRGTNLISFNDHSHLETGNASLITYR